MEEQLLRRLYQTYRKELYLYIYSLCKNHELAEDILQETFLKAILSLQSNHTNMRAWLYMVARNLYFNYSKQQKRRQSFDELDDNMIAEDSDVLEKVVELDKNQMLYKALQNIERTKREVLTLQYFCGLSQKEISATLHLSPEYVRVLSYRGKRELKKYLEANGYDIP